MQKTLILQLPILSVLPVNDSTIASRRKTVIWIS